MTQKIKKAAMYFLLGIGAYLIIGYILHLVVFPEDKPAVENYFEPGQQFYSKTEGFRQIVERHEHGIVYCSLDIEPFADGPPRHIHTGFDETFEVAEGELSVWLDGKVFKLRPGDTLFVPRGVPHKPFNETGSTVRIARQATFPEKFAYYLSQVYGLMDHQEGFGKGPGTLLQMSLLGSEGFDSYVADGPPPAVQKVLGFLLAPLARLAGYRSFYPEYDIRKDSKKDQ